MQPKSNAKNVVLFFVLSAITLAVFLGLQKWLEPPHVPPADETRALHTVPPKGQPGLLAELIAMRAAPRGVPGGGVLAQLGSDAAIAQYEAKYGFKPPGLVKTATEPKPAPTPAPRLPAPEPPAKREYADLGGDDYKLQVKLTSHGGAVERVVLTHFRAADAMGRPADGPLVLVPEDVNHDDPSNVMFHYQREGDDRPMPTLGIREWTLDRKQLTKDRAVFYTDLADAGVRITKTYTLKPDEYHLGLAIKIERLDPRKELPKFRYMLTSGHGLPIEGWWYTTVYRNAVVGVQGERNDFERDLETSQTIGYADGGRKIEPGKGKMIRYAGVTNQYFESLIVVDNAQDVQDFLERARPTPEGIHNTEKPYLDDILMRVVTQPLPINEKDGSVQKYLLYYGPAKVALLGDMASTANGQGAPPEVVQRYAETLQLKTVTDYGKFGFWTYILVEVTNFMHKFLDWLHYVIPVYGFCIILLTLLVRGLMHPISRKQAQTSVKMQEIMPEVKALQEKYKGDRQALAREQMALYRKHGVHPLGSCWVLALQMPIFLGLYYALQESIHFRLASFLWIKNLAAPDMLIWWTDKIPWISTPENQGSFFYLGPYFNLLPVLAVALMMVQQKYLTPPPTDETQEMQFKMMKYMMVFMGLMFYKVAAGLCLYFIVSSVWGVAERKLLPKAKKNQAGAAPAAGGTGNTRSGGTGTRPNRNAPRKNDQRNGDRDGPFQKIKEMWADLLKEARKK